VTRVGDGCKPLDGVGMKGEDVDGVFEVEVAPGDKGEMIFGSTDIKDCLGGMVLLVNVRAGDQDEKDNEAKSKLQFGEVEVNGTTIRQAVTTWGARVSCDAVSCPLGILFECLTLWFLPLSPDRIRIATDARKPRNPPYLPVLTRNDASSVGLGR